MNAKLIIEILKFGSSFAGKELHTNTDIDDMFSSSNFLAKSQILHIKNELNKGKTVNEIIQNYIVVFPSRPQLVKEINNFQKSDDNSNKDASEFLSYLALCSYISFCCSMEFKTTFSETTQLLESLLFACKSSQSNIACSCFINVLDTFLRYKPNAVFSITPLFLKFADLYADKYPCSDFVLRIFNNIFTIHRFETDTNFFNFIQSLATVVKYKDNFFGDNIIKIIELLTPFLTQFQPDVMELLLSIHPINQEAAETIIKHFKEALLISIMQDKIISLPEPSGDIIKLEIPKITTLSFGFSDVETFKDGFDPSKPINFPTILDFPSFLSQKLISNSRSIIKVLKVKSSYTLLIESLFELLEEQIDSEIYINIYAIILFVTNEMTYLQNDSFSASTKLALKYFQKKIFNASITVFRNDVDFSLLNTFRSIAIDCLLSDDGEAITKILEDLIPFPLLLAECFYRFAKDPTVFIQKIETQSRIIGTLSKISLYYQTLFFSITHKGQINNEEMKISEAISQVRYSLFTLFAHLFSHSSLLIKFFEYKINNSAFIEYSFLGTFLSYLFEEKIRPYVLSPTRHYLNNSKCDSVGGISNILLNIIKIVNTELPGHRQLLLLNDIILMLNECLFFKRSLINFFKDFCHVFCSSLLKLSTDEVSKKIFENTISFFAIMSPVFKIENLEIDAILTSLSKFNDAGFVDSLYQKLIQLLAGECLPSITPQFIVQQPQIIKIFVQLLFSTPRLPEVLEFILSLLKHSPQNLSICANCDLDIYILDFLERAKHDEKLDEEVIKIVLSLYSLLSSRHATSQSVLRFISLLAPLDSKHVTRYESLFLSTFESFIKNSYKIPEFTFPINGTEYALPPKNETVYKGIEDGFSIALWLCAERSQSDLNERLCSLSFNNSSTIYISLSSQRLLLEQCDDYTISMAILSEAIPLHTWIFVVINYKIQPTRNIIFLKINCIEAGSSTISCPSFDFSKITFTLGDSFNRNSNLYSSSQPNSPTTSPMNSKSPNSTKYTSNQQNLANDKMHTQIGSAGLFPLLNDESMIELYELRARTTRDITDIKYFEYIKNSDYHIKNDSSSFVDILVRNCGIDTILPIFKIRNYVFKDGSPFDFQFDNGVLLLSLLLTFSDSGQLHFLQDNGFTVLGQLIQDYWSDTITIKNYMSLVTLMQSLSNEDLQKQLFDSILTYFPLILKFNSYVQVKILRYWSKTFFPSLFSSTRNFFKPGFILSILRKYYWYKPSEPTIISNKNDRPKKQVIERCRPFLFNILYGYYSNKFTEEDFNEFVSHCISCTEIQQTYEMIEFLKRVFSQLRRSIQFKLENNFFIFLIQFFIGFPDAKMQFLIIDLMICCFKNKLITGTFFTTQLTVLMKKLPDSAKTKEMLDFIRSNLQETPILLPIMCYFVLCFIDDELDNFIDSLHPSNIYINGPLWAVWPLLLAAAGNPEQSEKLISFLIHCAPEQILSIFAQVDVVFGNFQYEKRELEKNFIDIICKLKLENIPQELDFLELSKRVIFYQLNERKTALENIFKTNKIFNISKKEDNAIKKVLINNPLSIFNKPENILEFSFGVQFTGSEWIHQDLAIKCLNVFLMTHNHDYEKLDLALCAFLQDAGYNGVLDHLKKANIENNDSNDAMINLLVYHTELAKKPQFYVKTNGDNINPESIISASSALLTPAQYDEFKAALCPNEYFILVKEIYHSFCQFCDESDKLSKFLNSVDISSYASYSTNDIQSFEYKERNIRESSKKHWNFLWGALSMERAPWFNSESLDHGWKRDFSICFALTPLKIIRNSQIDLIETTYYPKQFNRNKPLLDLDCILITLQGRYKATIAFSEHAALILAENNTFYSFNTSRIRYIFLNQEKYIVFITELGLSLLLEVDERQRIIDFLSSQKSILCEVFLKSSNINIFDNYPYTKRWIQSEMSNFEYLMILNYFSGKNFNNLENYPIAPWILTNYTDDYDENNIRDFKCFLNGESNDGHLYCLPNDTIHQYLKPIDILRTNNKNEETVECDMFKSYINKSTKEKIELIPEFFSMPEVLNNINLPTWAKSPIDFVYKHRKMLESDKVSLLLHEWFTLVFGNLIFPGPHPRKTLVKKTSILDSCLNFNSISNVYISNIIDSDNKVITVITLSKECYSVEYKFSTVSSRRRNTFSISQNRSHFAVAELQASIQAQLISDAAKFNPRPIKFFPMPIEKQSYSIIGFDMAVALETGHFLVAESQSSIAYILLSQPVALETRLSSISCLAADKRWIAIGGDSSICLFFDAKYLCSIQLYRDSIISTAISSSYRVVIGGTKDGYLIVCSSLYGAMIRLIDLKKMIPIKILITNCWGFIVAYCQEISLGTMKYYLMVFTVNGEVVQKQEIDFQIEAWSTWSSETAFDYLLIASSNGSIYYCEAYDLSMTILLKETESRTVSVHYLKSMGIVVVTKESGKNYLTPLVI